MTKEEFDTIARDTIAEITAIVKEKIEKLHEETGIMCEGEVNMSCRTLKIAHGIGFCRRVVLDAYDPSEVNPNYLDDVCND